MHNDSPREGASARRGPRRLRRLTRQPAAGTRRRLPLLDRQQPDRPRQPGRHRVNQRFITGASGAGMMAVSGGYLYWANTGYPDRPAGGGDTIGRARLDGTGVNQKFIPGASWPIAAAVGGGYLYWTNNHTGTIGRARLNGTGVNQRFITGASFPTALAIDSRYIYWTNWARTPSAAPASTAPASASASPPSPSAAYAAWPSTPAGSEPRKSCLMGGAAGIAQQRRLASAGCR